MTETAHLSTASGFRVANVSGRAALVDTAGGWHDLARVSGDAVLAGNGLADPMAAIAAPDVLRACAAALDPATADGSFADALAAGIVGAPVPRPRSVFAVGLNYGGHAAESGMDLPANPLVFTKFPSCIVGPNDDVVLASATADYEVELVVVIGEGGRNIAPADAWRHVVGVTIGQDISDRALQFAAKPPHFDLGKSRDTYGPMGPVLVSTDAFTGAADGGVPAGFTLTCDVNGERRQSDTTEHLIFDVPTLIAYLSSILTLATGDVIFTGTPDGIGASAGKFLADGDVIVSSIEGIGTMTNVCRAG
jgi:2,4-didehydro-3-deoxy-L-rhamnonate hydrolase